MHFHPQPKPEPRKALKKRERTREADYIQRLRMYLVGRERGICRCCLLRACEHMHEILFRSLGGHMTRRNSVMICSGCHSLIHAHEIDAAIVDQRRGSEGPILFIARTDAAAAHMRVTLNHALESKPGSQRDER